MLMRPMTAGRDKGSIDYTGCAFRKTPVLADKQLMRASFPLGYFDDAVCTMETLAPFFFILYFYYKVTSVST